MNWYVVHVRQGREQEAADKLACTFRLTTYYPEIRRRRDPRPAVDGGLGGEPAGATLSLPLFPGYLFVQWSSLNEEPAAIDRTPGCGRLVRVANSRPTSDPISLSAAVIDWLRAQEEADVQSPVPLPGLEGALNELLSPRGRVALLLQAIGAETPDEEDEPAVKRLRRTRGRGRKIHY